VPPIRPEVRSIRGVNDAHDRCLRLGLIEQAEAIAVLHRTGADAGLSMDELRARLDTAIGHARTARDYSSATATPRRDLNPALARRLGIDMSRSMNSAEIANLLNGQSADGADIAGKQKQRAAEAIGHILGMTEGQIPSRAQLEHVLAGPTANHWRRKWPPAPCAVSTNFSAPKAMI
jgi:hypothetical protein